MLGTEIISGSKAIFKAPDSSFDNRELDVNFENRAINKRWKYEVSPLCPPYSIHTAVGESDKIETEEGYLSWLDFSNLKERPLTARSIIFIRNVRYEKYGEDIPLETRLSRVKRLAESFLAYESIMEDISPNISKKDLEKLLNAGKLPRPMFVDLGWEQYDGNLGLNFVVEKIVSDPNNPHQINWLQLLNICKSGELVKIWKELVSDESMREIMFAKPKEDPNRPEIFYKDEFCQALTGLTVFEIHCQMAEVAKSIENKPSSIKRDEPRTEAEIFVDRFEISMSTLYVDFDQIDSKPIEELYEIFQKFRKFETYTHRNSGPGYREFYDPVYQMIEDSYQEGNYEEFTTTILVLLNNIIHD